VYICQALTPSEAQGASRTRQRLRNSSAAPAARKPATGDPVPAEPVWPAGHVERGSTWLDYVHEVLCTPLELRIPEPRILVRAVLSVFREVV